MTMMFIIFKILIIVLCILLVVFISILFIPFKYFLIGTIHDNVCGKVEIRWLFGLFKVIMCIGKKTPELQINIFGLNILKRKLLKELNEKKEKSSKKRFKSSNIGKELILELLNFIKDIFNYIKPKELKIVGVCGFEDPSLTGMLLGLISVIRNTVPNAIIDLESVFDGKVMNVEAQIYGDAKVYILCYRAIKLLMKKEIRKILFKKTKTAETF